MKVYIDLILGREFSAGIIIGSSIVLFWIFEEVDHWISIEYQRVKRYITKKILNFI